MGVGSVAAGSATPGRAMMAATMVINGPAFTVGINARTLTA